MSEILITWLDRSRSEVGQKIYRATSPIDKENLPPPLAVLPPDTQQYKDSTVLLGVKYYYLISVFREGLEKFTQEQVIETSLPNTGPGPTTFVGGDSTAGFLGEVPFEDLIHPTDLITAIDSSLAAANYGRNAWLKFVLDGKILFIPLKPIQTLVSPLPWTYLNDKGAVYGERQITIRGYRFKIRLPKGLGPDTSIAPVNNTYDHESTWGSEWNRLFYPISESTITYPHTSQEGDDWYTYTNSDIYNGSSNRYTVCQEYWPGNTSLCVTRGNSNSTSHLTHATTGSSSTSSWRPVLELITDSGT